MLDEDIWQRNDAIVEQELNGMTELHDHPPGQEWSEPMKGWRSRIKWRFVVVSWLIALAVTILVSVPLSWASIAVQGDVDAVGAEIALIIAGFATFLVFFGVMFVRLRQIDHDRLLNSMAVALLHTFVSLGLGLLAVIVFETIDRDTALPGDRFDELGLVILSLDRPSAAAIVACALAAAIMPARGPVPKGTQTDVLPTDRQL
jgi:hypothetical protein